MIVGRVVTGVAAGAAMAAAAGVVVVAAAFAVFTLLQAYVGPSGAAAIIAAVLAVGLGVVGLVVLTRARSPRLKGRVVAAPLSAQSLPQRAIYMLRERPLVAAGAAVAAGLIAWRNPRLLATVMSLAALRRDRD